MGLIPSPKVLSPALTELVGAVRELLSARAQIGQESDWGDFWSPTFVTIADAVEKAQFGPLQTGYQHLVSSATLRYERLVRTLDFEEKHNVIDELGQRDVDLGYKQTKRSHDCPACGNTTLHAIYNVTREIYIDDSDAPHSVAYVAREVGAFERAVCPVCDLKLDREFVGFTDIPLDIFLGEGEADEDEIEAWRDEQYERDRIDYDYY